MTDEPPSPVQAATAPSSGQGRNNIWIAIIGAAATIIVGYLGYLGVVKKQDAQPIAVIFSGRVWNEDNKTVENAKVSIAEDQNVPQLTKTDADGIFHVQLSPKTQSLKITVDADGYAPLTKDANPHRTGTEEIYMHRLSTGGTGRKSDLVKAVTEFEGRLSDVEEYERQLVPLANSPLDSRQGLSVLIWRAWFGSSDYANAVPEYKGVRWKGVLGKVRELGVNQKYSAAYQAITEIEEGDIEGKHFTAEYLKPRIDVLRDYRDTVLEPAIK